MIKEWLNSIGTWDVQNQPMSWIIGGILFFACMALLYYSGIVMARRDSRKCKLDQQGAEEADRWGRTPSDSNYGLPDPDDNK